MAVIRHVKAENIHKWKSEAGVPVYSISFKFVDGSWGYFLIDNPDDIMPSKYPGFKDILVSNDNNGRVQIHYHLGPDYIKEYRKATELGTITDLPDKAAAKPDSTAKQEQNTDVKTNDDYDLPQETYEKPAYLDRYPAERVQKRVSKRGREYFVITIPNSASENGWATMIIWSRSQFKVHTDRDGTKNRHYVDIKLASKGSQKVKITIKEDRKYSDTEILAAKVVAEVKAWLKRQGYKEPGTPGFEAAIKGAKVQKVSE